MTSTYICTAQFERGLGYFLEYSLFFFSTIKAFFLIEKLYTIEKPFITIYLFHELFK